MLEKRSLGRTGLEVSALGLGAGRIGDARVEEREVAALLDSAFSLGITLIDTARGYGLSEERLGRILGPRRRSIVLTTKVGYGVEGHEDWTAACVAAGIERALRTLATDVIDVVFLHSCPASIALRHDVLSVLDEARRRGRARAIGYSGENEDLDAVLGEPLFEVVQISVSPWDQGSLDLRAHTFTSRGLGVLAKRPLAAAPWLARDDDAPDVREYRARYERLAIDCGELGPEAVAIRFAAHAPSVASALAGTTSVARLRALADAVSKGPLPAPLLERAQRAWRERGDGMRGVI